MEKENELDTDREHLKIMDSDRKGQSNKKMNYMETEESEIEEPEREFSSGTEKFLALYYSPELLSRNGKLSVIVIWTVITGFAFYGISQLETDFDVEDFIDKGSYIYNYLEAAEKYFESGRGFEVYVDNAEIDYSSKETQLQMLEFDDKLHRCAGCRESWVTPNTLKFWYHEYHRWVGRRECEVLEEKFDKTRPDLDARHPVDQWNNFIF